MIDDTCATNCSAMPAFTLDDIIAATEKMRAIPKPPKLEGVVFVMGDDVPAIKGEASLTGWPVRVVRSQYAKGITPLPASIFEPVKLCDFPIEPYEPKEPSVFDRVSMLRSYWP